MTGAIAPLADASQWLPTDVSRWLRGDLLAIVLLVLGAVLLTRLAGWVRDKIMAHIEARATETDELVRSEGAKHRQVVAQVVTWSALAVIYVVTAVLVVERLGVPLAGLVAPAALISAALGFGRSDSSRTSAPGSSSPGSGSTASATSSPSPPPA